MVVQMHQEQVTSATITIDDGGGNVAKANVDRYREGKCQGSDYDCYSLKEASDIAKANVKAPTTTATR